MVSDWLMDTPTPAGATHMPNLPSPTLLPAPRPLPTHKGDMMPASYPACGSKEVNTQEALLWEGATAGSTTISSTTPTRWKMPPCVCVGGGGDEGAQRS